MNDDLPQTLKPSVLDRLIDPDSRGTAAQPGYTMTQLLAVVQRDLEELLNAHRPEDEALNDFEELGRSVFMFGLPDLMSPTGLTLQQQAEIAHLLEQAVARFEPRLRDVRASPLPDQAAGGRTASFRLRARLCVDPAPEVVFETVLELTTGRCSVSSTLP